jgi:alpha-glucosidase
MGEIHIFDVKKWIRYYGTDLDEIHFPVNFSLLGLDWNAESIRAKVDELEQNLPPGAWPNYVLANHDDLRIRTRYGSKNTRSAAMLLLTLRGTPCLYYGDEIGMKDVDIPPEMRLDPAGIRQEGQSRDGNRTPMHWSSEPWAGFSPPETKDTWLPIADDYQHINVEFQLQDPESILNYYRTLLQIRKEHPALQVGDYQSLSQVPEGCYLYTRQQKNETFLVVINFTSAEIDLDHPLLEGGNPLLSSLSGRNGPIKLPLILRPHESILVQL